MIAILVAVQLGLAVFSAAFCECQQSVKVTTRRAEDRVEITGSTNKLKISLWSPTGVSSATFERLVEQWPSELVIELHLNGLEYIKIENENLTIEASVSSQDGAVRIWRHGDERSNINSKDADWIDFQILDRQRRPTKQMPLTDGVIEFRMPKKLLEDNPTQIKLEWIDFYRG